MIGDGCEINTLEKCVTLLEVLDLKSATLTERAELEWSYDEDYDRRINLTGTCAP